MTSRDFCYWLQGFFEITDVNQALGNTPETLSIKQIAMIRAHLKMVFIHEIDPSFPAHQQEALNEAHANEVIHTNPSPFRAMC